MGLRYNYWPDGMVNGTAPVGFGLHGHTLYVSMDTTIYHLHRLHSHQHHVIKSHYKHSKRHAVKKNRRKNHKAFRKSSYYKNTWKRTLKINLKAMNRAKKNGNTKRAKYFKNFAKHSQMMLHLRG